MTRSAAMKNDPITTDVDLVPVALQAVPSDVMADSRTKQQTRHSERAASGNTHKLHPTTGSTIEHADRPQAPGNTDSVGLQRALQVVPRDLAAPLCASITNAVTVGMLLQIRRRRFVIS